MNGSKVIAALLMMLLLTVSGNNVGLVLSTTAAEPDSPAITATVNGVALDIAAPNQLALPATVVFTASMPVTIYYTTNGAIPTTSDASAFISFADQTATGPTITSTDSILVTLGLDTNDNPTPLMTYTFANP